MKTALIIACSAGKNLPPSARMEDMPQGITAHEWLNKLGGPLTPARELYTGETFRRLSALAPKIDADLFIVSAGLGLINGDMAVPSYEASFSNEVAVKVSHRYNGSNGEWLRDLAQCMPPFFPDDYDLILAAVPDGYEEPLELLLGDSVLFITTRPGRSNAIVYDRRLNDPRSPYKGRDVDYKARAFEHYIDNVFPGTKQSDLDLSQYEERKRAVRPKITDEQLIEWLKERRPGSPNAAYQGLLDQGTAIGIKRLRRIMSELD